MATARRNFWLAWVAATVAGGLISLVIQTWIALPATQWFLATVPASNLRDTFQVVEPALLQMLAAGLVAVAQAFVLRRVLGRGVTWVTAALVGALLAWFVTAWLAGQLLAPGHPRAPAHALLRVDGLVLVCVGALLLSACLWVACLGRADRAGSFILASVAAAAILFWFVYPAFDSTFIRSDSSSLVVRIELTLLDRLVSGSLTGLALAFTLIRPRPASRRAPTRAPKGTSKRGGKRRPARAASR